jgi:hypothetical protein
MTIILCENIGVSENNHSQAIVKKQIALNTNFLF